MLFLFSPRGMGIAPIIELPVVSGRELPLLSLPRFHGFGANESQPSGLLVLNRAVVVLKLRIAFLPWLVLSAVLVEARDSDPCTVSTGLSSLGIESTSKVELKSQDSAVGLQVVFVDTLAIHPQTYALVADELHNAYRFFNGCTLLLIAIKFVLVDPHAGCFLLADMLQIYTTILGHGKYG